MVVLPGAAVLSWILISRRLPIELIGFPLKVLSNLEQSFSDVARGGRRQA